MSEKDQSVNNTEEDFNVETEDNQNDTNIENSVSNTDNSEANASDSENNSEESIKDEESESQDTKIKELEKLANDNEEKYLRLYAEFENYKRRIQKENQINATYKAQGVLTDILPSIDNIERALQIEGDDESFKSLQKGVQMVHESLLRALKDNGLEEILAEGKEFDPNLHQAVVQDDNPDFKSGEVTQELQKGYKLKDRVLRPSMVKVNQ
ncbi:nucleotide exchange factor GrpE [Staphylococcus epidermidis]|jgi:grpE|uniref:Protein GrpE n=8 Tax=root TaxID=1 RepID=GRPE_STAEQ|nr:MULTISPECIES: nucleotide exchange factor GrpE [Staphylococcus]Q5HNW5.1 RecName: Full=Protein GrpE; AltName: Full=HSP-70 cofactor [Staphylococcus epidermidis RP62A]Q8CP16.1 RecName: Full=Protein GrpE; AltName: Full=HSP-70 cofactor [Staphylococcus epidermidis ATCC 12228]EHQ80245.1 co-chaperone GrpE [Staphylococcus epidermidis VCU057]EHR93128.1 co-chaperone GrpE [Staphylococcus epidermidis VCU123]EID35577.1 co-chaperone GrpE [Staphylococcus epidermidis IS-250]EJD80946.1 protein GrpE [Staphylo